MEICNVLNWIQKIVLNCAVWLIVKAVQKTVDSCNVVNWIQKMLLLCVLLLIMIVEQQSG